MAGILNANAAQSFFPGSLFANSEQGVWYDPSDMATLFQDAAGTTPVTAVEQPVGLILDKSGRGNHASQSTSTARPVLSARYNLLTRTEEFDDAAWSKSSVTVTANAFAAPDGTTTADKVISNNANTAHYIFQSVTKAASNVSYRAQVRIKAAGYNYGVFAVYGSSINNQAQSGGFDLINGTIAGPTIAGSGFTALSSSIESIGDGWFLVTLDFTSDTSAVVVPYVRIDNAPGNTSYNGDGTSGIYIWGADLRVANDGVGLPPYQRVGAGTAGTSSASGSADYDTAGFPLYLRLDGVDDFLVTGTITPGIDKAQVFAGVRKLSDLDSILAELSVNFNNNNGIFYLSSQPSGKFGSSSRGSQVGNILQEASISGYPSPATANLTSTHDITASLSVIRANGVNGTNGTFTKGTGNFLGYPLYIGRRGGSSLPFNGRLYSLAVRFGANLTDAQIAQTETWVNSKTRAF
jgi:hypothetical protein